MLIDDAKGSLAALREAMQQEQRVTSSSDLNVGDIVYQCMDERDGLTLKDGYTTRKKYFVIVGKKSKGDAIGLCLINSDLDFYKNNPKRQAFQYTLKQSDYPEILEKDSRLDCAELFTINTRKSVAVKAETAGHLTHDDENKVISLVASCGFIDAHKKKVYRIGLK